MKNLGTYTYIIFYRTLFKNCLWSQGNFERHLRNDHGNFRMNHFWKNLPFDAPCFNSPMEWNIVDIQMDRPLLLAWIFQCTTLHQLTFFSLCLIIWRCYHFCFETKKHRKWSNAWLQGKVPFCFLKFKNLISMWVEEHF